MASSMCILMCLSSTPLVTFLLGIIAAIDRKCQRTVNFCKDRTLIGRVGRFSSEISALNYDSVFEDVLGETNRINMCDFVFRNVSECLRKE